MLVGDCPSPSDDEQGEPFAGDQGLKLRYLLKRAGIKYSETVRTFAIKCKPGNTAWIKKTHVQACQKHLMADIIKYRPKIIVAMGKQPLLSLLGENATKDFRGYFYDIELNLGTEVFKTWVIPTYSMSACLMDWAYDAQVIHDLEKAKKFCETGKLPTKLEIDTLLVDDLTKLKQAKEELLKAERLTADLETTSLVFYKAKIVMIGFCPRPGRAVVFPFFEYDIEDHGKKWDAENKEYAKKLNNFVAKNKEKIRRTVAEIMKSDIPKDGFNFKYDHKLFKKFKMPVRKWVSDPIIAHALIDENAPHSLTWNLEWWGINHLSETCYGPYEHDLWKYVNKDKKNKKPYSYVPPLLLANYLSKDVDGSHRLRPIVEKKVRAENLWGLYKKQQIPLVKLLSELEFTGIACSTTEVQYIAKKFNVELSRIDKNIKNMVGNLSFNSKSPKQVLAYLEKIDAPLEKKSAKTGEYSTAKGVLEELGRQPRKPWGKFARLLTDLREISKLKGTYLDGDTGVGGLIAHIDERGRVHTNYNAHTPRTGRLSSDDPNLQNIPRPSVKYPWANIRRCFHPTHKGWIMWSIDFKQLEMRIAAYLSRDPVMIKEIRDGVDIHTRNCVMFGSILGFLPDGMTEKKFAEIRSFKRPANFDKLKTAQREDVEKALRLAAEFDEHRTFAKSLGFGVNYGLEAATLAKQHDRDVDEVQGCFDLYFKKYAEFADWRELQCETWLRRGYLKLPITGRKRRFFGASDWFNSPYSQEIRKRQWDISNVDRQAMNFPIQGFANEIFTRGKIRFCAELKRQKLRSRALLTLHDGILGEGPREEFEQVSAVAHQKMKFILGEGKRHQVELGVDVDAYNVWAGEKVKVVA